MPATTSPGPYTLQVYTDNPVITLRATQTNWASDVSFAYHWLDACTNRSGGRLGAFMTSTGSRENLIVEVRGNPVLNELADVEIRGATGQWLHVVILDERGYPVSDIVFPEAQSVERNLMTLQGPAGLYLLSVSTPTQYQVVKVLKL